MLGEFDELFLPVSPVAERPQFSGGALFSDVACALAINPAPIFSSNLFGKIASITSLSTRLVISTRYSSLKHGFNVT